MIDIQEKIKETGFDSKLDLLLEKLNYIHSPFSGNWVVVGHQTSPLHISQSQEYPTSY